MERARYLGNIIAADGSTRGNVDKRIAAAKQGFQALYGIWGKRRVDTDLQRELFQSMVQGALLSGMEAEVLSNGDINRMESTQCTRARRALGSNGSHESGRGRQHLSHADVGRRIG